MDEMDEMRAMNKKSIAEANSTKTLSGMAPTSKTDIARAANAAWLKKNAAATLQSKAQAAQIEQHRIWEAKRAARLKGRGAKK